MPNKFKQLFTFSNKDTPRSNISETANNEQKFEHRSKIHKTQNDSDKQITDLLITESNEIENAEKLEDITINIVKKAGDLFKNSLVQGSANVIKMVSSTLIPNQEKKDEDLSDEESIISSLSDTNLHIVSELSSEDEIGQNKKIELVGGRRVI